MRPDRASVWRRLGEPDEQQGSVNEPRTVREAGLEWNERWIYHGRDGARLRVVLWNRYDLCGVFRVEADGSLVEEGIPGTGIFEATFSDVGNLQIGLEVDVVVSRDYDAWQSKGVLRQDDP